MRWQAPLLESESAVRLATVAVAPAAGSSSTNPSFTSTRKSWSLTWPAGVANACPRFPDTAWFTLAPDWVCEVLSASTAIVDRTRKQDIYREHGVPWLWFVDPTARTIEVLSRTEHGWMVAGTFGGEGEKRIPPFDAVAIDIGVLWDISPPAPTP